MDEAAKSEQRSIQSIEVGFRLIRVLEEAGARLPLKTLSARAQMPPGKAHLYLVSFMRLGLVIQDPATTHYGLGPYALELGIAALGQLSLGEAARGPVEALHQRFELPAYVSIWGKMGPFIVLNYDAELPTPFSIKMGFVFPLLTTATGRIFLAHMPARLTEALVARESALHPDIATRRAAIETQIREQGFAASEGHLFRGFSALSAPIFDHEGALAGAVSILGVGTLMQTEAASPMVLATCGAARSISAALGFRSHAGGADHAPA